MPLDGPRRGSDLQRLIQEALVARLAELQAPPQQFALEAVAGPADHHGVGRDAPGRAGCSRLDVSRCCGPGTPGSTLVDSAGAHQLTRDDIRDHGDAMTNLRADSVDQQRHVRRHRLSWSITLGLSLRAPFLLVAATDGCFGYLPSPMHFEHMLLTDLA